MENYRIALTCQAIYRRTPMSTKIVYVKDDLSRLFENGMRAAKCALSFDTETERCEHCGSPITFPVFVSVKDKAAYDCLIEAIMKWAKERGCL